MNINIMIRMRKSSSNNKYYAEADAGPDLKLGLSGSSKTPAKAASKAVKHLCKRNNLKI